MTTAWWIRALLCLLALSPLAGAVTYPVRLSTKNPRVLADAKGLPFLLQGDCAWGLMVSLDHDGVERYLENRRQKGFNTVVVMLIANHGSINGHFIENYYSVLPFTSFLNPTSPGDHSTPDFTTPNEAYFTNCDWVIQRAATKGIQVVLAPCYVGYNSEQGWQEALLANGLAGCRAYGRFVGNRYKNNPNIIWLHSGDNGDTNYFPYIREIAAGIAERDPNHLATAKLFPEQSAREFFGTDDWLSLNTTYAYGIDGGFERRVYDKTLEDFNASPPLASFLVESTFENEHNADDYWVRRQAYWSVLSGSSGQVMGNRDIWPFYSGWEAQLDGPASESMSHLKWLFDRRPWHAMTPDQDHSFVTAGYGTFGMDDYLTALRSTNGSTVIAYVPTRRTFTVNLARISGAQANAWWFNPRTGRATFIAAYPTAGPVAFTPPDFSDWLLVVDDAAQPLPSLDPFLPGKFTGLFRPEDGARHESSGFISASMTSRGTYSGYVLMGSRRFPFNGKLTRDGFGTNAIRRPGTNSLSLELEFTRGDDLEPRLLLGRVTDGNWAAPVHGEQVVFNARTNRAPMAGRYTLSIAGHDDDSSLPAGFGYGTATVSSGGLASFSLVLADGSKLIQNVPVSANGLTAFYAALQKGRGSLSGWLAFTNRDSDDLNGSLTWIKAPEATARYYPTGFNTNFTTVGSLYTAPSGSSNLILLLTNATVAFAGGNLAPPFTNAIIVSSRSQVTNLSSNALTMSFTARTGTFKGSVMEPGSGRTLSFTGAVLQRPNGGAGFALGTNQSSRVWLGP